MSSCSNLNSGLPLIARDFVWLVFLIAPFLAVSLGFAFFGPAHFHYQLDFSALPDRDGNAAELSAQIEGRVLRLNEIALQIEETEHGHFLVSWRIASNLADAASNSDIAQEVTAAAEQAGMRPSSGLMLSVSSERNDMLFAIVSGTLAGLLLVFFYWQRSRGVIKPGIQGFPKMLVAASVALGVTLSTLVLIGLFGQQDWLNDPEVTRSPLRMVDDSGDLRLALILQLVFLGPIAEEVIFRGWMLERFRHTLGVSTAFFASSLGFALIHYPSLYTFPVFLLAGFALGWLWLRYRSIWICIFAHSAWNLIVLAGWYLYGLESSL